MKIVLQKKRTINHKLHNKQLYKTFTKKNLKINENILLNILVESLIPTI